MIEPEMLFEICLTLHHNPILPHNNNDKFLSHYDNNLYVHQNQNDDVITWP